MRGVSVIICCYNSAMRLPQTLAHLARQETGETFPWELIIVDNASTDDTVEVAKIVWESKKTHVPLIILEETKQGLIYARKKGVAAAQFETIVFCDDDNWLAPDYLSLAMAILDDRPDVGIVGGRNEAVSDVNFPGWFYEYQWVYACGALNNNSMDFTGNAYLRGAGMVIRKLVVEAILNSPVPMLLTGRKGAVNVSGDDDEMCLRAWLLGFHTWYDYRLFLKHYMPDLRLNTVYRDDVMQKFRLQGDVVNAYFILFRLTGEKRKWILAARQCIALSIATLRNHAAGKRIASTYLYFLTRWPLFANPDRAAIWNYYKWASNQGPDLLKASKGL